MTSPRVGIIAFAMTLIIVFFIVFNPRPSLRQLSSAVLFAGWAGIAIPVISSDEYPNSYFGTGPSPSSWHSRRWAHVLR